MITRFLAVVLALVAANAPAAVLVEIKTQAGLTRVYSDGARTRLNLEDQTYVIVDSKAETLYVVDPHNRQVSDMSQMLKQSPRAGDSAPVVEFEEQGSGPRVAGYKTVRHRYLVGKSACGTVLASEQALQDTGLADTFRLVQRLSRQAGAMTGDFSNAATACAHVTRDFSPHVGKIGIPMRVTDTNGRVESEVMRIEKNAILPVNAFSVPAGYRKNTVDRRMIETEGTMRQMQEKGQIPADILEQFQQMQKQ